MKKPVGKNIERKSYYLTILGVIISVAFGAFGIYTFFYEKKAEIRFKILASYNVLDIKESVSGLSVIYKNENLREKGKNLKILKLKVVNTGELDIVQNQFDSALPWGFTIANGNLVEAKVISTASKYLGENYQNISQKNNGVIFPKTIFERKQFVNIDILVVHDLASQPQVLPIGKIVGIENFPVENLDTNEPTDSFLKRVLSGGVIINMVRVFFSFVLIVALLLSAVGLMELWDKWKKAKQRRRRETQWSQINFAKFNAEIVNLLKGLFIQTGERSLVKLVRKLSDSLELQVIFEGAQIRPKRAKPIPGDFSIYKDDFVWHYMLAPEDNAITAFIEKGFISKNSKGEIAVHPEIQEIIAHFRKSRTP